MRRLIFLQIEYKQKAQPIIDQFYKEIKLFPFIKAIKDYAPKAQVLIEFDEKDEDKIVDILRKIEIVEIIDPFVDQA